MKKRTEGLSLYWDIIKKGRWFIIGGTLFLMAVTALISFILPPVYESSMIIEAGKLYPVPETGIRKETELIEEPMAMAELLKSGEFLDNTRKKLNLDLTMEQMEKRITVEQIVALTRFQRSESTLIEVIWEGSSPGLCVEVLNSLANQLIEQHRQLYNVAMKIFSDRIKSQEKQIIASEKVIASQKQYQEVMKKRLVMIETSITDYEQEINKLDFSKADMNELLFFKASINSLKEQLIEIETEINEAEINIGEQEEIVRESRDWIANIEGYMGLSRNTEIRSRPVLPDEPIKPDKALNIVMAAVLGLLLTVIFVFFSYYTRAE